MPVKNITSTNMKSFSSLLAFAVFATSALGFPVAHAPAGVNVTARANSGKRGLSFLDAGLTRDFNSGYV